jgi:GNAT superfamily N-acetyltransferase
VNDTTADHLAVGDVATERTVRDRVRTVLTLTSPSRDLEVGLDTTVPPEIRPLTRAELDVVLAWGDADAAPDPHDATALWEADPSGLWGVDVDGVLVAAASELAHQGQLGRIGFVVVRPEMRKRGIGQLTIQFLVDDLLSRLAPGAAIILDATLEITDHAERLGFVSSGTLSRMQGTAEVGRRGPHTGEIRALTAVPFELVVGLDTLHTGVLRESLMRTWISPPGGLGLGVYERGELLGMGVARRSRTGLAIGPLYASEPDVAQDLFSALTSPHAGAAITLDVPMANPVAVAFATGNGLAPVATRTTMGFGDLPVLPIDTVYGTTSYELG